MEDILKAFALLWTKWWFAVVGIAAGVIGKFSYDMVNGKKFSKRAFWSSLGVCIFVGYLAAVLCKYKGWVEESAFIVPVCTALSQSLMQALAQNWDKIYKKVFGSSINKIDEKD